MTHQRQRPRSETLWVAVEEAPEDVVEPEVVDVVAQWVAVDVALLVDDDEKSSTRTWLQFCMHFHTQNCAYYNSKFISSYISSTSQ